MMVTLLLKVLRQQKAEKLGVSANGMNLSIKESAKAEEVIATVHIMSVDGKETTKKHNIEDWWCQI